MRCLQLLSIFRGFGALCCHLLISGDPPVLPKAHHVARFAAFQLSDLHRASKCTGLRIYLYFYDNPCFPLQELGLLAALCTTPHMIIGLMDFINASAYLDVDVNGG